MKNKNNKFVNKKYYEKDGKYTLTKFGRPTSTHGPSLSMQPTSLAKLITPEKAENMKAQNKLHKFHYPPSG